MGKSRDTSTAAADIDANTADIDANAAAIAAVDSAKANYTYSASAPVSPATGDQWMDTSGASPKGRVWNGSEWKLFSGASAATFDEGASTGATFSTVSWGGRDYRVGKCTAGGQQIVVSETGIAHTLLILGGGGGGGGTDADGSSYPGGGGGSGGYYWVDMDTIAAGTYTADAIGAGGTGGGNRTNGTSGGQTLVTIPGVGQVTCGGGSSGDGLYQSPSGYSAGANGGTRGGNGGQQSAPGQSNSPGEDMMPDEYRLFGTLYGQGQYGGSNTGNGGSSGKANGASGVFLIAVPLSFTEL